MKKMKKKGNEEAETSSDDTPKKKKKLKTVITDFTVSANELELFKEIAGRGSCKITIKPVTGVEGNVASKDCVVIFNSKNSSLTIDGR